MPYTRMKHIVTALTDCAERTGYEYDFLAGLVDEMVAEGDSDADAVDHVIAVADEYDL